MKAKTGAKIGIGEHIKDVQRLFRPVFDATDLQTDGSDFDHLFGDGERFKIGELDAEVMYTPGHTPADVTYRIADAAFVGDTLFMPDYGTARADFPGGDARQLYRSIQKVLALPPETRLFMCHDYKAPGRDAYAWETTVREERASNVHLKGGVSEDAFVAMRNEPDAALSTPRLLLPSIQVNIPRRQLPAGARQPHALSHYSGQRALKSQEAPHGAVASSRNHQSSAVAAVIRGTWLSGEYQPVCFLCSR